MFRVYSRYFVLAAVFFLILAAFDFLSHSLPQKNLEVDFFDVGQGDAIFIETPSRYQILIDGGSDEKVLEKLGREMAFFDRSLDLVIATHGDADHIGGLIEVLRRYEVKKLVFNGYDKQSGLYREFLRAARERGLEPLIISAGQIMELPDGARLIFLWPEADLPEKISKKHNNTGIVAKLIYGNASFLLTADIEDKVEKILAGGGNDLRSDILKVAHHGSKTSTTEEFLRAVRPQTAVISVGADNSYGHPHPSVLERLDSFKIPALRTDLYGDIEILSDGAVMMIKTDRRGY